MECICGFTTCLNQEEGSGADGRPQNWQVNGVSLRDFDRERSNDFVKWVEMIITIDTYDFVNEIGQSVLNSLRKAAASFDGRIVLMFWKDSVNY